MAARCSTRWKPAVGFTVVLRAASDSSARCRDIRELLRSFSMSTPQAQHGDRVLIFGQGQQQMLQRRVFMAPLAWPRTPGRVQGLFEILYSA